MLKPRTLLAAGGAAVALAAIPLAANAAGPTSSCSTTAPSTSGQVSQPTGQDGGVVWVNAADPGSAGISGNSGYLYASGSSSSGVAVLGTTKLGGMAQWPAPMNGYARVGTPPGVCISVAGQGVVAP